MYPSLLAEKFTLRPLRDADALAITAACKDPEIIRWCTSIPLDYTEEKAHLFIAHTRQVAEQGSELVWGIDFSGVFAGVVSLFDIEDAAAEVGFWLAPQMRGRGIAAEALGLVVGVGLDPQGLGLDLLRWTAIEGNEASERVARAVGFTGFRTVPDGTFARQLPDGRRPTLTARKATLTREHWAEIGFPGLMLR